MPNITMYSTRVCPFCVRAEALLKSCGVESINKILIDQHPDKRAEMMERTGRRTVPQIYVGDTYVGGFDELSALHRTGELTPMLAAAGN